MPRIILPLLVATLAAASLLAAAPADRVASARVPRQIPCDIGPQDRLLHVAASPVVARLATAPDRHEYRTTLRNPNAGAADLVTLVQLPGVVGADTAVHIPPHGVVEVVLGWVSAAALPDRQPAPAAEQVDGHFTFDQCRVAPPAI